MKRPPDNVPAAALLYAEAFDWCVFPVPPGTKKSHKSAKYSNGKRWGASNKASVIERDFRRWPKANLGIPTGAENGFWVLEADTPKGHGVNGIRELRKLERKYGKLPKTLMAISPSGSLHYYFEWPKRGLVVVNSASKVAPGVDVRGEGGMVLAPPSIKKGVGRYRFLNWGTPIARAPKWLLKLVVHRPACSTNDHPGSDACGDVGLIKAALEVIPAESYQVWFEVGCALSFELCDSGFALFDAWSATSRKYDASQCAAKWRECSKIFTYKLGTIIHYANQESPAWRVVYEARRLAETYSFFRK